MKQEDSVIRVTSNNVSGVQKGTAPAHSSLGNRSVPGRCSLSSVSPASPVTGYLHKMREDLTHGVMTADRAFAVRLKGTPVFVFCEWQN